MKFATAEPATTPRSPTAQRAAWAYTALLVVMVIGQLFGFEKFIPLIESYWLPGGHGTATLVACLIVITEIFALPFLLRMPLSPLMRWFSLACGVAAAALWVLLGLIAVLGTITMTNSGVLGVKVGVPSGGVQLLWALGMSALAAYSVWGLWPNRKK